MHHQSRAARILALLRDQGRDDYLYGHPITAFDEIAWVTHTKSQRTAYEAGWQTAYALFHSGRTEK